MLPERWICAVVLMLWICSLANGAEVRNIAGDGISGYRGDGGEARNAQVGGPFGLVIGLIGVGVFMVMFGFFYLAMQFMQLVMGYSPLGTALALSPLAVPMLILSPLSSWYLPKLGLRVVVVAGLGLLSVGLLSLCLVRIDSSYWAVAWPLLVVLGPELAPLFAELSGFRREEIRQRINQLVPEQPIAQLTFRLGGTGHV